MQASSFPFLPHCATNGRRSQWLALWYMCRYILCDAFAPESYLFLKINAVYFYRHSICSAFVAIKCLIPFLMRMNKKIWSIGLSCCDSCNGVVLIMAIHHFFLRPPRAVNFIVVSENSPFVILSGQWPMCTVAVCVSHTHCLLTIALTGG